MTLNTKIYINGPIDVEELFAWGNANLIRPDHEPVVTRRGVGEGEYSWQKDAMVGNRIGQGFCAIFEIEHREGAPISHMESFYPSDYDEDDPESKGEMLEAKDELAARPDYYAEITFDTSYGFSDTINGVQMGCSALHSWFIYALVDYCDSKGVTLSWINEFSGEYYRGLDGLETLLQDGRSASDWFHNMVVPAITNEVTRNGGKAEDINWS